jgi:hypothetical protein
MGPPTHRDPRIDGTCLGGVLPTSALNALLQLGEDHG